MRACFLQGLHRRMDETAAGVSTRAESDPVGRSEASSTNDKKPHGQVTNPVRLRAPRLSECAASRAARVPSGEVRVQACLQECVHVGAANRQIFHRTNNLGLIRCLHSLFFYL
jgi:hypothetical protein